MMLKHRMATLSIVSLLRAMAICVGFGMVAPAFAKPTGLVVTGIGGNDDYDEQFMTQGQVVVDALRSIGENDDDFVLLQSSSATREAILAELESIASEPRDAFYLVLIGHGTVDPQSWRFNILGQDLTTEDLVAALSTIEAEQQTIMVGTSASGALLDVLSQPGRHVVTATKSGGQLNAVRFPEYMAKAMETEVADIDRNEILTLAEVYRYANEQTQKHYEDNQLLASEHARIASDEPARVALARLGALRFANDDPAVAALLEERLVLEDAFLSLKEKKDDMPLTDYYGELEEVLVSLAFLQQKIDTATGWVDSNE